MKMTPNEIAARLATNAEKFCQWLLPNGKKEAGEWCVGSIGGEAGKSLKVHLSGNKAGIWCDFATGEDKGDLLDLLAATNGVTIGQALKQAKEWLGIREFESVVPAKTYSKPDPKVLNKNGVKRLTEADPVMEYLMANRNLTQETITEFKVAAVGREMAFPSYSADGAELLNVKYIGIDRTPEGKKQVRQEKGCAPALFGWNALPKEAREVIITEGQIDAMTWHQMGFAALSVPDGVASDAWIEFEWENLERFETIWLNFDNDKPGQVAVGKVAQRLGRHRCLSVTFQDYKDANDAFNAGLGKVDFDRAISKSVPFTPMQIKSPIDFRDLVVEQFYPASGTARGLFPRMFGGKVGFRPGELTLWTGVSGHGKSVLLSQIILEALTYGQKAAMASMEMRGEQTLKRAIHQIMAKHGITLPTVEQIDASLNWLTGKLWIYDVMGNVPTQTLFELMEYSRCRHGVDHFVIDSLMKCAVAVDDYEKQRVFLDQLSCFAKREQVHIHLVAHARKGRDEYSAVGQLDVKGTSEIINQADNIMVVWRNKPKETDRASGKLSEKEDDETPDCKVYCQKQRETGIEGVHGLWYGRKAFTFFARDKISGPYVLSLGPVLAHDEPAKEPEPPKVYLERN